MKRKVLLRVGELFNLMTVWKGNNLTWTPGFIHLPVNYNPLRGKQEITKGTSTHLVRLQYYYFFLPKTGDVFWVLTGFVWTRLNAAVATLMWNKSTELRSPRRRRFLAWFQLNPEAVCLEGEHKPALGLYLQPGDCCSKTVHHSGQSHRWCESRTFVFCSLWTVAFTHFVFKTFSLCLGLLKCTHLPKPQCGIVLFALVQTASPNPIWRLAFFWTVTNHIKLIYFWQKLISTTFGKYH